MNKKNTLIIVGFLFLIGLGIGLMLLGQKEKAEQEKPFRNLFEKGFQGITTQEKELKDVDYISSKHIEVKAGETIWYGPCDTTQSIQMAIFDKEGNPAVLESRQRPLKPAGVFSNNLVIYKYEVPKGVEKICFTVKTSLAEVYTVSKTEITCLNWVAYWDLRNIDTKEYVGENQFYEVAKGDKLYFGAITKKGSSSIALYNKVGEKIVGTKDAELKLVESFSEKYGIYCYTVNDKDIKYIEGPTEGIAESYYGCVYVSTSEKLKEEEAIRKVVTTFGVQRPLSGVIDTLQGKKVLFLGDDFTSGREDEQKIYESGGWPGRIDYFCNMDVVNQGVNGAYVTQSRDEEEEYIYSNLTKMQEKTFDYIIMQGLHHDAEGKVALGTKQGKEHFDPNKADVSKFADALEMLFYKAQEMYPNAKLGYIVDFKTEQMIDQLPYVEMIIAICEEWGVSCLDLYHDESFKIDVKDGLYPTSSGYDTMYLRIATWMASLDEEKSRDNNVVTKARVMSYNVFWSATDEVPNKGIAIKDRVKKVQNTILTCDPDILVLQEVSTGANSWISILREFVKENEYGFYGFGHYKDRGMDTTENIDTSNITGSDVEMTPILWKTEKYECVEKGHYWASSTPEKAGSLWKDVSSSHSSGKLYPRCVNWLVLKDKETKEHIMIVSYHADPYTEKVRKLSAQLVMEKTQEISSKYDNLAVVLAGDWNMERKESTYDVVVGNGYADSQIVATKTTSQATFNAWKRASGAFAEADYIFVNHNIYVSEFQVYNEMDPDQMGIFVSDHCPIISDIEF